MKPRYYMPLGFLAALLLAVALVALPGKPADAQTAVLNLDIEDDNVLEVSSELLRVALASDTDFDAESGTNVGGGADPMTSGTPAEPQGFLLTISSEGAITVPADWPLLPDGLNEGDEFRLIFMTSQKRDATSSDIADYDTFVQNSAGGSSAHTAIKSHASRFKVVGSTREVDARDHTGTDPNNDAHMNVPIYWLNGKRVAADNSRFWSTTWENWAMADRRNEAGNRGGGDLQWSGTAADGTASLTGALGENTPTQGQFRISEGTLGPMNNGQEVPKAQHHSFYVISPVFRKAFTPAATDTTVPADWPLLPDGLNEGNEFRLIFMTSQRRDATSSDIADYDAFVQNSAGGSGAHPAIKPYASLFKAVGSTRSRSARDHTGTNPNNAGHKNMPIYWLNGQRVALNKAGFWGSTWEHWTMSDRRTEAGSQGDNDWHWTGTDPDGTVPGSSGAALGENTPRRGRFKASDTDTRPLSGGTNAPKAQQHSLYAISPVFKKEITTPGVEFRVCPSGATCVEGSDAGWVAHDSNDGPPTIELNEGGAAVSYQFRLRLPTTAPTFRSVNVKVTHPGDGIMSATHNAIRPGDRDYDRLICHGGSREIGLTSYPSPKTRDTSTDPPGPIPTVHMPRLGVDSGGNAVYSDQTGGCPHNSRSITWADRDAWQTVTVAAGEDPDAFDHMTSLVHYTVATNAPPNLFQKTPHVRANSDDHDDRADEWPVRIRILDDDEWEQDFEVSSDGGATWTSLFDGGFNNALPNSVGAGESHSFRVRLKNNPATLGNRPDAFQILSFDSLNTNARVSSSVDDWPSRGKVVDWPADTSNGAWNGQVTFTVHAADDAAGQISVKLRAQNLLRRVDNQLPVAGATHKTRSYTHNLTSAACVGMCPASIISHSPSDWPREWLVLAQQPEVSITAGSGVTEGGDASFTITANPAPAADLDVSVTVSQSGDYGAATGQQTVTIPTTGSATLTVSTTNDDADEADGSVTATLDTPAADAGYTVSATQGAGTVAVADDDDPAPTTGYTVDPQVVANVKLWAAETHNGAEHVNRWQRVLVAFGELDASGVSGVAMSAAEAQTYADLGWPRWVPVVAELTALEASGQETPTPEVSISAGSGVTEGGDATFTVTASPAPAANLDVSVTVSQSGDYGAATGSRTVTIPTAGSVTLTVGTTDDGADEADGSVTATLDTPAADAGYTVSATQGAATVSVADDDDGGYTVDPQVVANVKLWMAETYHGTEHVNRWQRVLVAFGALDAAGVSGVAMSAAEAQTYADLGWPRWVPVVAELTALEAS